MRWIFLSPHLDDAVLSCGGLLFELVQAGNAVSVWTVCAGDPPPGLLSPLALELHRRWRTGVDAPAARRREDVQACKWIGAAPLHFDFPECIYRRQPDCDLPLIGSNDELFQPLPDFEKPLVEQIAVKLTASLDPSDRLVSPLAVGGHIDHHLVRSAAESLGRSLHYYPDFPYIASEDPERNGSLQPPWLSIRRNISDEGLAAWQKAVTAYRSQISTFWTSSAEMLSALRKYRDSGGGGTLWTAPIPG